MHRIGFERQPTDMNRLIRRHQYVSLYRIMHFINRDAKQSVAGSQYGDVFIDSRRDEAQRLCVTYFSAVRIVWNVMKYAAPVTLYRLSDVRPRRKIYFVPSVTLYCLCDVRHALSTCSVRHAITACNVHHALTLTACSVRHALTACSVRHALTACSVRHANSL